MNESEFDRHLHAWLLSGPSGASPHVLQAVAAHVRRHPARRSLGDILAGLVDIVVPRQPVLIALRPLVLLILLALVFAFGAFVYGSLQPLRVITPIPSPTPSTSPTPAAYVCPPGSNPDLPGPIGQARPSWSGFSGPTAFDRGSGRLVTIAGDSAPSIWAFDVCTNTWQRSAVSLPSADYYPGVPLAYDEMLNRTVVFGEKVIAYDVDNDELTVKGESPLGRIDAHAVYRSATGQFVVRDDGASRLWSYDLATDRWEELAQQGQIPPGPGTGASLLAYDPAVDRLVLYIKAGSRTAGYVFDFATSAWTRQVVDPPPVELVYGDLGRWEIAYDEAHARTVVYSRNRVVAYDSATGEWQIVYDQPSDPPGIAARVGVSIAYDSMNQRILVLGGRHWPDAQTTVDADDVVAFDLETNDWAVLLEPR